MEVLENDKAIERKCGYNRETGSIFGSGANKLKLNFVTGDLGALYNYGFWLEVVASPPKENHKIEIRCNKGGSEGVDIFQKLKVINEKLKRLNQTLLSNKKLNINLKNKAKIFLETSNKKLLNMTSSIAQIGKKLHNSSRWAAPQFGQRVTKPSKLRPIATTQARFDLEAALEEFLASKGSLNEQMASLDRIDSKLTNQNKKSDGQVTAEIEAGEATQEDLNVKLNKVADKKADNKKTANVNNAKKKFNDALKEALGKLEKSSDDSNSIEDGLKEIIQKESQDKKIKINLKKPIVNKKVIDKNSDLEWIKALDSLNNDLDVGVDLFSNEKITDLMSNNNAEGQKPKPAANAAKESGNQLLTMAVEEGSQVPASQVNGKAVEADSMAANAQRQNLSRQDLPQSNSTGTY